MRWKREEVCALIDVYQLCPCLWNCKLSEYKNRDLRHQINDQITIAGIRKKIHTIRGQYKREHKLFASQKSLVQVQMMYKHRSYGASTASSFWKMITFANPHHL